MLKISWSSYSMSLIWRRLNDVLLKLINKFSVALFTCTFALGGAAVGAIAGAIKGQTTETGLSRGFVVGAVAGAVTAVQLMDLVVNGLPFPKVALIRSLINGKVFREWVSPALLKAYQWQMSAIDTSEREFSDIFDIHTLNGLSQDSIKELPIHNFNGTTSYSNTSCSICLEDLKNGEVVRWLPRCKHIFHVECVDEWLMRQGSCPICRKNVSSPHIQDSTLFKYAN
ncbi:NEP1-interacting protein-like 1 [Salvia miltiorrhiza]|uniref:NEP1-interacting protein-like 1 n=1 Tax=Salvia miltiorrhiza TaxID=226208 RepID=UPI0025AD4A15|nr:NEP1-interacting protein-like 1 [Salvia miltiorrhiza]